MYLVSVTLRLLLALLFLFAGITKLAGGLAKVRKTLSDFGIPLWLVSPLSIALPAAEFSIALLLLPTGFGRVGAISALGLLVVFNAAIATNLARAESPTATASVNFTRNQLVGALLSETVHLLLLLHGWFGFIRANQSGAFCRRCKA